MKLKDLKVEQKGFLNFEVKTLNESDEFVTIEGYATVNVKDRDGDVVTINGIDTTNFLKNPIVLYQHDRRQPIGKVINIQVSQETVKVKCEVYKDMSKEAYVGVKNGILKTFSIGFIGKNGKYDDTNDIFYFTETELLEVSVVSIPSNTEATFDVVKSPCGEGFCLADKHFKFNKGEDTMTEEQFKELQDLVKDLQAKLETLDAEYKELKSELEKSEGEANEEIEDNEPQTEEVSEESEKEYIEILDEIEDVNKLFEIYSKVEKMINQKIKGDK